MTIRPAAALLAGAIALWGLQGCASSPKQTVLNLDTTDKRWLSPQCVAARKAAARYNDHAALRGLVGIVGNVAAPMAGTAGSLALNAGQDGPREKLNRRVRASCISDPLGERRKAQMRRASR